MVATIEQEHRVLVLRLPEDNGNFLFRVAQLPDEEARHWEQRLEHHEQASPGELELAFSRPLTLNEAMRKIQTRNFRVFDYRIES